MKQIGAVVLSFEVVGDVSGLLPWKGIDSKHVYSILKENTNLSGFVFLSTCNRVEIVYTLQDGEQHERARKQLLAHMPPLPRECVPEFLQGSETIRHLIRLAMGLESMVLGETEIRAQIKDAVEQSDHDGKLDSRLKMLFQQVFREARRIRAQIPLNNLPLSIAALAVKKLIRTTDRGDAGKVAIVGSGPMSRQSAEYLSKCSCELVLVNRTLAKIDKIAGRLGAEKLSFDQFRENPASLGPLQAVVTATSRKEPFITAEFVRKIQRVPRFTLVDMALPPDVAPECFELPKVELITLDSLHEELSHNHEKRREAADMSEQIVLESVQRLEANLIAGLSGPILADFQRSVRKKSREHLEHLLEGRLSHLSSREKRLIYTWAIQANRDLNRIHRQGVESVLRNYFEPPVPPVAKKK